MKTNNSEVLCDFCGSHIPVMLVDNSTTNPWPVYMKLQFGSGERKRGDFCNVNCFYRWVDQQEINKTLGIIT